ncbi:hypothetical protein DVH05_011508 [Phytophthora capsici]|nr:hypothetical protein DVH05_011508 [Phytophthora capsici]
MNETEFKLQFRMTQQYFFAIRDLVADHLEFQYVPGKQRKMSVELHLLSLLKVVGSMDGQGRAADYLSMVHYFLYSHARKIMAKITIHARAPMQLMA